MKSNSIFSLFCIKPDADNIVKPSLKSGLTLRVLFLCILLNAFHAWAEDGVTAAGNMEDPYGTSEADTHDEKILEMIIPEITAKSYSINVIRRSSSNRVYLMEDTGGAQPHVGRILLAKINGSPAMAFRVLKTAPDKKQVFAKRIKRYGNNKIIENGTNLVVVEKLTDIAVPSIPSVQDAKDLRELEAKGVVKVSPYDPELDKGTDPLHGKEPAKRLPDVKDELDIISSDQHPEMEDPSVLEAEDIHRFDPYTHWLSAGFGYIRNNGPPSQGGSYFFSAGNFRYGLTLGKLFLLNQPNLQDSLALESGVYVFKSLNFSTQGDAYTTLMIPAVLRYNVFFSDGFAMFLYGGINQGIVVSSNLPDAASMAALNSTLVAVGGGIFFQVGPSWYTRVDVGLDSIGFSLTLRLK